MKLLNWNLLRCLSSREFFGNAPGIKTGLLAILLGALAVSCSEQKNPEPVAKATNITGQPTAAVAPAKGPNVAIEFPKDEGLHRERTLEWWYLNAQFADAKGRKFSFFLCKFSTGRHLVSLFDKTTGTTWVKDYY